MLQTLYAEVRACADALRRAGFTEEADAVVAALLGSTSGEILTDLGCHLSAVLGSNAQPPGELNGRLGRLLAQIDRILADAGQG